MQKKMNMDRRNHNNKENQMKKRIKIKNQEQETKKRNRALERIVRQCTSNLEIGIRSDLFFCICATVGFSFVTVRTDVIF